jgi:hypothetical protein
MKETPNIQRPTPNIQGQTCEFGTRELTKKEWETKLANPFVSLVGRKREDSIPQPRIRYQPLVTP